MEFLNSLSYIFVNIFRAIVGDTLFQTNMQKNFATKLSVDFLMIPRGAITHLTHSRYVGMN